MKDDSVYLRHILDAIGKPGETLRLEGDYGVRRTIS
jgi:hypothetical protein